VDRSDHAVEKMKSKIRRKAHKLYLWRKKNHADYDRTAKAMIRSFDRLFYDLSGSGDFTWTRFYFPLITSSKGLHQIGQSFAYLLRALGVTCHKNYSIVSCNTTQNTVHIECINAGSDRLSKSRVGLYNDIIQGMINLNNRINHGIIEFNVSRMLSAYVNSISVRSSRSKRF
jgi:hypothetical protein